MYHVTFFATINSEQSLFYSIIHGEERKTSKHVRLTDLQAAMPQAACSAVVRRQAKRETGIVSYNNLDVTLTG